MPNLARIAIPAAACSKYDAPQPDLSCLPPNLHKPSISPAALAEVTRARVEPVETLGRFHALGYRNEAQIVRKVHERADQFQASFGILLHSAEVRT